MKRSWVVVQFEIRRNSVRRLQPNEQFNVVRFCFGALNRKSNIRRLKARDRSFGRRIWPRRDAAHHPVDRWGHQSNKIPLNLPFGFRENSDDLIGEGPCFGISKLCDCDSMPAIGMKRSGNGVTLFSRENPWSKCRNFSFSFCLGITRFLQGTLSGIYLFRRFSIARFLLLLSFLSSRSLLYGKKAIFPITIEIG